MHHALLQRALRTTLLCAGLAFTAHSATAASYSQLIAFGDSLSDKAISFRPAAERFHKRTTTTRAASPTAQSPWSIWRKAWVLG